VGKILVAILIVNKLANPQGNLFSTDLELRTHGFADQERRSRRYNQEDYATRGK
jgi:hypothetical protein